LTYTLYIIYIHFGLGLKSVKEILTFSVSMNKLLLLLLLLLFGDNNTKAMINFISC